MGLYWRYEHKVHQFVLTVKGSCAVDQEQVISREMHRTVIELSDIQQITPPYSTNTNNEIAEEWYDKYHFICHAGGQIEGRTYTNSMEAMAYSYAQGNRLFDVDLRFTTDSVLVARHDWSNNLEQGGMAMEESRMFVDANGHIHHYSANSVRMTYEQFKNSRIFYKYTPVSCEDVIRFMQENVDAYIIPDMKTNTPHDYINTEANWQYLVDMAKSVCGDEAEDVLGRIIVSIYSYDQLPRIKAIHPFRNVIARQHQVFPNNYTELAKFCVDNDVHVVNLSRCYVNDEGVQWLLSKGIRVWVAVVDYMSDFEALKRKGITGAVTNNLYENDYRLFLERTNSD